MQLWPYSAFSNYTGKNNFTQWNEDGYQLGVEYVYLNYNLQYNQTVSDEYIAVTQNITTRQIALAGYRLGDLINSLKLPEFTLCSTPVPDTSGLSETIKYVLLFFGGLIVGGFLVVIFQFFTIKAEEEKPLIKA